MAYIREKITKSGFYYYLVESHRVNGKVVKKETYIGTKLPREFNHPSFSERVSKRLCPECRRHIEEGAEGGVELCPKCDDAIERLLSTLQILKDKGIRETGLRKK